MCSEKAESVFDWFFIWSICGYAGSTSQASIKWCFIISSSQDHVTTGMRQFACFRTIAELLKTFLSRTLFWSYLPLWHRTQCAEGLDFNFSSIISIFLFSILCSDVFGFFINPIAAYFCRKVSTCCDCSSRTSSLMFWIALSGKTCIEMFWLLFFGFIKCFPWVTKPVET